MHHPTTQQATSPLHLFACVAAACLVSFASLLGFYATVSFFHTRAESAVGLVLCTWALFLWEWLTVDLWMDRSDPLDALID